MESILIVPDAHRPYHDERAWKLMMKVARDLHPTHLYIIGDFMDFYTVSSHSKNPNRVGAGKFDEEVTSGMKGLDELDGLKAKHKTYIGGNHEDRLTRYLQDRAPDLISAVSVPNLLHLKERGWRYVSYKDDTKLGKMYLTHDVGTAGRTSVFNALDTYQHTVVTGHSHRLAYIVEGNAVGESKLSCQFGWLGDAKRIDYMQRAKVLKNWALGFGIGYLDPTTKLVYMTPIPIVQHTCVFNGKLYKG